MAQTNFQVGDIVQLKSGGPSMSIQDIVTKQHFGFGVPSEELPVNLITVQWFDSNNKLQKGKFSEPSLKKVDE